MFKQLFDKKRDYRIFEGLRVAVMLTFVSGFIDAFTYLTQGGRFAGMQTGNLIYLMIHLSEGEWSKSLSYLVPIIVFMLGQIFTYLVRDWASKRNVHWHIFSGHILLVLLLITCILAPLNSSAIPIIILSFYASVQVDTFRKIRGVPYANIMMTGNIRSISKLLIQGIKENNHEALKKSRNIAVILFSFMIGVGSSAILVNYLKEYTLYLSLFPILVLNYILYLEIRKNS